MKNIEIDNNYLNIVRDNLNRLGEEYLLEDVDLLAKYIVIRFLKTSPHAIKSNSTDEIIEELNLFLDAIYPFVVTLINVVNSSPISDNTHEA